MFVIISLWYHSWATWHFLIYSGPCDEQLPHRWPYIAGGCSPQGHLNDKRQNRFQIMLFWHPNVRLLFAGTTVIWTLSWGLIMAPKFHEIHQHADAIGVYSFLWKCYYLTSIMNLTVCFYHVNLSSFWKINFIHSFYHLFTIHISGNLHQAVWLYVILYT